MSQIRALAIASLSLTLAAGAVAVGPPGNRTAAVAGPTIPPSARPAPPTTEATPPAPPTTATPVPPPTTARPAPAPSTTVGVGTVPKNRAPGLAPAVPAAPSGTPVAPGSAPSPAASSSEPPARQAGRIAGIVVAAGRPAQPVHNLDLGRVRDAGLTHATVAVFLDVDPLTQSSVRPGPATMPDADLLDTMRRARDVGLRPIVNLILQCTGCANAWRGALAPSDVAAFFASYRDATAHYADLARQGGAALFVAASEMTSLQRHTDEWRRVLAVARQRFGGPVTYGANWDALDGVGFWDAVDVVGVSAYFPLSDAEHPRYAELVAAWRGSRMRNFAGRNWFDELAALARRTGKQVVFTEAGYRSATYAARWPGDASGGRSPDETAQADAYRALLATFDNQPWWAGVSWWEWISATPPGDTSFSPRDKEAEQVLRRWYRENRRA